MMIRILVILAVLANLLSAKETLYSKLVTKIPEEFKGNDVVFYHIFKFSEDTLNGKNKNSSRNYHLLTKNNNSYILDVGIIDKGGLVSNNSFKLNESFNIKIDKILRELVIQADLKFADLLIKDTKDIFSCNLLRVNFLNENVEVFYYILNEDENLMKKAKIHRKEIIRLEKFISFLNFIRNMRLKSDTLTPNKGQSK